MYKLIDEPEIRRQVAVLGERISGELQDRPLTVVGVLTGSIVLVADVIRQIETPVQVDFVRASSYRGRTTRSRDLTVDAVELPDLSGRDVLLVDDILDTGRTLRALAELLRSRGAASVRTAVLLWKRDRTEADFQPDYFCFAIPDVFVVGYGLDYDGDYRHLPYIAVLEPDDL